MPDVSASVVICTRNRPQPLQRCLEAVREVVFPHEVLVIDNASDTSETREIAAAYGARCIAEPIVGVNRARNRGMRNSVGDIVAYVDDDVIPSRDWLTNIASEFGDPAVMAVGGRILAEAADHELANLSDYDVGATRQVVDRDSDDWFERANFGGLGNGANMAFRRSGFPQWGPFDERIGYGTAIRGFGDHNAFFRVVQSGGRAVYTPDAVVVHPVDGTFEEVSAKRLQSAKAWGAYITLLSVEYPEHRVRIAQYLFQSLVGTRRAWRATQPAAGNGPPRWRSMLAAIQGPTVYMRVRRS